MIGTTPKIPYIKQSSPTDSAVLPNVQQGMKYVIRPENWLGYICYNVKVIMTFQEEIEIIKCRLIKIRDYREVSHRGVCAQNLPTCGFKTLMTSLWLQFQVQILISCTHTPQWDGSL